MKNLKEIEKCLDKYNLSKLKHEETEKEKKPNIGLISNTMGSAPRSPHTNKSPRPNYFTTEFYKT